MVYGGRQLLNSLFVKLCWHEFQKQLIQHQFSMRSRLTEECGRRSVVLAQTDKHGIDDDTRNRRYHHNNAPGICVASQKVKMKSFGLGGGGVSE